QRGMVVEDAVAGADDCLAASGGIPGQRDARLEGLVVVRNALNHAELCLTRFVSRGARAEDGAQFDIVAQAVVEGEVMVYAPSILKEGADGLVVEGFPGVADALNE